ncbi:tubulin-specific chaperone E isoform X1 [Petromyzon marinus]|uniref:tubulin-specific chaperone E isoform X1 n=2 Tax=Petromyzon marinus TaxID=7757 RepID=UPI003F7138A9
MLIFLRYNLIAFVRVNIRSAASDALKRSPWPTRSVTGVVKAMDEMPEDVVGRRVLSDGECGRVRFVGEVPPTQGLWFGVEWDDPERGKHDGSHGGVRYFHCQHPTGGSFIRPKKADLGVPFLSAVRDKYAQLEDNTGELPQEYTSSVGSTSQKIPMQVVGMEKIFQKQSCLESLKIVALSGLGVNSPGPAEAIREACPNIGDLDISRSLLSSWQEVALITEQLCNLSILILSKNRLDIPETPRSLSPCFSHLTVLVLNSCSLTWSQVLVCAEMWPNVEHLELLKNNITTLETPVGVLQALRSLNLEGNSLEGNEQINHIAMLPSLESLRLDECGLTSVHFDDVKCGCQTSMFPKLTFLSLYNNKISEWSSINELDKLQSLEVLNLSLEFLETPEINPNTVWQIIIAKIARLRVLNHSKVCNNERSGAERDYLKRYGLAWLEAGGRRNGELGIASTEFTAAHPRYASFVHKHGAPEDSELKEEVFTLKSKLVAINITCPDLADHKTVEKKVPNSMTVQKLKGMLCRLLKVQASDLVLTYTSHKMEGQEFELDNDLRPLRFYSIEDGDNLVVRW